MRDVQDFLLTGTKGEEMRKTASEEGFERSRIRKDIFVELSPFSSAVVVRRRRKTVRESHRALGPKSRPE